MQIEENKKGATRDFDRFNDDNNVKKLKKLGEFLKKRYGLNEYDLLGFVKKDIVPISAFTKGLGPLEAVVRFMKDALGYRNKKIAEILKRSEKTASHAYKSSKEKVKGKIETEPSLYNLPLSLFGNRRLSILENCVVYCRENLNLRFSEISELMQRDSRTIWTSYSRAKKK